MLWVQLNERGRNFAGYIPSFLSEGDSRPAREQLDANYQHGGGWRPMEGWTFDEDTLTIQYPGDPPYEAMVAAMLRDEVIVIYPHGWVLVLQIKDKSFEIARMD